jgi:hypothetical protein
MKLAILFLIPLAVWSQGLLGIVGDARHGGPVFVSPVVSQTFMNVSDLIFPAVTTTTGNTLVVVIGINSGCAGFTPLTVVSTIGGSASGDSFVQIGSWVTQAFSCVGAFRADNVHAGAGNYVVTATVTAGSIMGMVLQFSGLSASSLDQTCSGSAASGSPGTCSSAMTPTSSPQIIVGGLLNYYEADTITAGSGYILPTGATVIPGGEGKLVAIYQIANPASGTYNPAFTIVGTQYWSMIGFTLK